MWPVMFFGIGIFVLIISKCCLGSFKTPITFFSFLWCLVGGIANLCLYDYYPPSDIVNIIILSGVILFTITYGLSMQGMPKALFAKELEFDNVYINWRLLLFVNIVAILVLLPTLRQSLVLLRGDGLAYLRANSTSVYSSGMLAVLNDSIIRPLFVSTTVMSCVYLFTDNPKKKKIWFIILAFVENLEMVLMTAGRAPIVNMIFYFVITLLLFRGRSIRSLLVRERKKVFFAILLLLFVFYLTEQRSISTAKGSSQMLESFYVYYFSGPSYFSRLLENVTQYGPHGQLLYGAATFGFITNIFSDLMIILTHRNQGSLYLLGSVITNKQYSVGAHTNINAMCTCFYPFILDWGYLGVVIGILVLTFIAWKITKNLYREKNIMTISLYVFFLYVLIRTVFKWDLLNLDFTVVILSLYVFTRRRKLESYND